MRITSVIIAALIVSSAHTEGRQRRAAAAPSSVATNGQAATKGILEPVNFSRDIKLTDAFFVSADVGWVAGQHATIIKTTDGGSNWTAQVGGDPANGEPTISALRFLDARRGWALEEGGNAPRLLRTTDGENWEQFGNAPRGVADYAFTNSRHGIAIANGTPEYYRGGVYTTDDSGKSWKPLTECTIMATIQGTSRKESCWVVRLQMLSTHTGYVLARWFSPESPNANTLVLLRTDDAGETWQSRVLPLTGDAGKPDFMFLDPDHGLTVFNDGRTFVTGDGGVTWKSLVGTTLGPQVHFADPQVGWTMAAGYASKISYTTDGGLHWSVLSQVELPAGDPEYKFALPRRDRGYIIGSHGMVYRYRVVPQHAATAPKTLTVPAMPTFDVTQLAAGADHLRQELTDLQLKLGDATATTPQSSLAPAPAVTGFTQERPANPATAFTEDIAPIGQGAPSPTMQSCCAARLSTLQTDVASWSAKLPVLGNTYRSLSLVTAGFSVFSALRDEAQQLRTAFGTLKSAKDAQAAAVALQQLAATLTISQQTLTTGLGTPGLWYASGGGGFVRDVGGPFAGPATRDDEPASARVASRRPRS